MISLQFIQAVCILIVHALLLLNSVSESRHITNSLIINSPKNIWVVSSFGITQINLLWISMCKFICENIYISWVNTKELNCFVLQVSSYYVFEITLTLATSMSLPVQSSNYLGIIVNVNGKYQYISPCCGALT